MIIGSGDISKLLSGKGTKGYRELWSKFIDPNPPYYNAKSSPINALRTGAILETQYSKYLGDDYYSQVKVVCPEMDVLKVSLDFAMYNKGAVVLFEELKTIFLPDFIEVIKPMKNASIEDVKNFLKKNFKKEYNQFQSQLIATGLDISYITFLSVKSYNDEENETRVIEENDLVKFPVKRDIEVVELIKERLTPFQYVKDHFND